MPRFRRSLLPLLLLGLFLALCCDGAARAEEKTPHEAKRLKEIERALKTDQGRADSLKRQTTALAAEIAELRRELVAAAAAAQDHEAELSRIEDKLAQLKATEAEKRASFAHRRALLTHTLAALERLSLRPPEALILGPDSPIDTVRSAILLQVAVPALKTQAAALRQEIDEIHDLGQEIERRRAAFADAATALDAEQARIAALIERKRAFRQTTAAEQAAAEARIADLAREADDLRDLLARLEAERQEAKRQEAKRREAERQKAERLAALPPPPPPQPTPLPPDMPPSSPETAMRLAPPAEIRAFPAAQASLIAPARGRLVTRFGEMSRVGLNSKGITIATRGGAQVVAPFDGQIVFRGPFRGYGEILIIEHRGGYHTVLVGLGRTDVAVGQWLLAGEPVGIMGPATDGDPELYLELRHGGEPIDPLPWLKIRDIETVVRE